MVFQNVPQLQENIMGKYNKKMQFTLKAFYIIKRYVASFKWMLGVEALLWICVNLLGHPRTLPAQYADSVDLKGGLLNIRVCTFK